MAEFTTLQDPISQYGRQPTSSKSRYLALVLVFCVSGCGGSPEQYYTRLGNGCVHVVDNHQKHGIIVDTAILDGAGKHYYPKADGVWCDRIAVSGDYVFGEVVKYNGDSVRSPATVSHYFAFCTVDKSVQEFSQMEELREFGRTVGVESIAPLASKSSESKPLY